MLTFNEVVDIINNCSYKDNWKIVVRRDHSPSLSIGPSNSEVDRIYNDRLYLQLEVTNSIDTTTKLPCNWRGGKRYLSLHMCNQEVVGIVFGMIKDAEMHELHEWFRYKGSSIYNPHLDPDALAILASKKSSFITRVNAMTMDD